jgi:RNA polymerase sigma-70 factor (ECF subfamily)
MKHKEGTESFDKKHSLDQSKEEAELSKLMRLSQEGDSESYRLLLTKVKLMLSKYIAHSFARLGLKTSGSQEDVLQEILLGLHLKRNTYDPAQFFLPWVYAIARYKVIDHLRKNKVMMRSSVSLDDELENVEQLMTLEDVKSEIDVEKLCECLPAKQRDVLKMVKIEGLSVEETSRKTGFSASDVKVTVHRAIKTLQQKVKESEI